MKIPRNLSSEKLIILLHHFGYRVTRQKGSHIRLTRISESGQHHVTVPNHDPLRIGTLSSILNDVASHLKIPKEDLLK